MMMKAVTTNIRRMTTSGIVMR